MIMRRIGLVVLCGVAFWAPTTAIELVTQKELSRLEGTFIGPATLILCYLVLSLWRGRIRRAYAWMLVGVYTLGPWFMFLAFMPSGGGFAHFQARQDIPYLLLATVCPPLTVVFSGYNGTL